MEHIRQYWRWLAEVGASRSTGWRWRRDGLIETFAIAGRIYVSAEAIAKFHARAKAGEFSKRSSGQANPSQTEVPKNPESAESHFNANNAVPALTTKLGATYGNNDL